MPGIAANTGPISMTVWGLFSATVTQIGLVHPGSIGAWDMLGAFGTTGANSPLPSTAGNSRLSRDSRHGRQESAWFRRRHFRGARPRLPFHKQRQSAVSIALLLKSRRGEPDPAEVGPRIARKSSFAPRKNVLSRSERRPGSSHRCERTG